jgi:chromosome segregation ATPase
MPESDSTFRNVVTMLSDATYAGWSWMRYRFRAFRLRRRIGQLKNERHLLMEQIGERWIDLGLPIEDSEIELQLERLSHERRQIEEEIQEKEQEIQSVKSRRSDESTDREQRLQELNDEKERLDEKLKMNKVSLERAEEQKTSYEKRLRRKEHQESEPSGSGSTPELAPEGMLGPAGQTAEEDTEPQGDPVDTEELEKGVDRTQDELTELRRKRKELQERKADVKQEIEQIESGIEQGNETIWSSIRSLESDINDLERKLDGIDREKKEYARELGKNLHGTDRLEEPLQKYERRLDRIGRRMHRTEQELDDVERRIETISSYSLLLFWGFWLCLIVLTVGTLYLILAG